MANYKGISLDPQLIPLIPHMEKLEDIREELSKLAQQWDLLTILGQITGGNTDMGETREAFNSLTSELLGKLAEQVLHKTLQGMASKGQVAVDIVIRNLFERTADIGFLATDDEVRAYLKEYLLNSCQVNEVSREFLRKRFAEYVAKYSVYDDIVLLDSRGTVVCRLDQTYDIHHTRDAIVKESIETKNNYVESYKRIDLCPKDEEQLIYSYKVTESDDQGRNVIGVLCLFFKFRNEMERVFGNLVTDEDWTILTILDREGRVIASSDSAQVPLNSVLRPVLNEDFKITKFGGKLYLSKSCRTKGYQGFMGPGWLGHAMVPLEHAFKLGENQGQSVDIDSSILNSVMNNRRLFPSELAQIPLHANHIQSELNRAVWNGNLRKSLEGDSNESSIRTRKVLLREISSAGYKTKEVFEESIRDLHLTVVSSLQDYVKFLSSLAIDIMDRNLYERANDCRWWALNSTFRQVLTRPQCSVEEQHLVQEKINSILQYINGLYTVYSGLFIYDLNGHVIGVSTTDLHHLIGMELGQDFVKRTLKLNDSQKYYVSPFESSYLYNGEHTYIYNAPILAMNGSGQTVGGIGIIFNSTPEFKEMLKDSLPRDKLGAPQEDCYALYIDRQGSIISSTATEFRVGERIKLPRELLNLENGRSMSRIINIMGHYFAIGATCGQGYREYKDKNDQYRNDVLALVMMKLGSVVETTEERSLSKEYGGRKRQNLGNGNGNGAISSIDVATFFIAGNWFGVRASEVEEAITADKITKLPSLKNSIAGTIMYNDKAIIVLDPHSSLELRNNDDEIEGKEHGSRNIIVCQTQMGELGLVIDQLGEILEVEEKQVEKNKSMPGGQYAFIESVIRLELDAGKGGVLVVLDVTNFVRAILGDDHQALKELTGIGQNGIKF